MRYFEGVKTIEGAKKAYKELAKAYHPDLGGCVEAMKQINQEYEKILQGVFEKEGKSITEIDELLKNDAALREKINSLVQIPDILIEICGKWIWVTGDTKPYKNLLKTLGFFWASKKNAWFWRKEEDKSSNRRTFSLDEIRNSHGSIALKSNQQYKIA